MSEAIYIGNTQQTPKKRMDGHFSNLLHLLKKRTQIRLICCPFRTALYDTTSHTDLCKCKTFKLVKHFNPIIAEHFY